MLDPLQILGNMRSIERRLEILEHIEVPVVGGGGGAIGGAIAATQVAYGTGVNTIGGEAAFTYNAATNTLTVDNAIINGGTASTAIYLNASKQITSLANAAGYLTNNGAGVLSWAATAAPTAHNVLSASHGDTTTAAVVRGDVITGQGVAPTWKRLAISVPAANVRNVLGVDNGDTEPAWKTALDANNPTTIAAGDAAAPGTSLVFAHRDHTHGAPSTYPATAHNLLSATHGDTNVQAVTRGSLIYGNSTPKWDELVLGGAAGSVVTRNATDVAWSLYYLAGTAGQTYTFGTTGGTIPTAAGTLTAATANGITAAGVITHAITNTSDGDTNPSTILSADANGALRVDRFGVGVAVIAASGTIALPDAGYIGNGSAAARLGFDSSAATDYAYFSGCYVNVGTTTNVSGAFYGGGSGITKFEVSDSSVGIFCNMVLDGVAGSAIGFSRNHATIGAIVGYNYSGGGGDGIDIFAMDALNIRFGTNGTERGRFNSSGDLLEGTTTSPGGTHGKALIFGDNAGNPTPGANTAGVFAKDVGGTVELYGVDEAGNVNQLTPHNYAGPVQPLPGVLHWSQYHSNAYAGQEKWYDMERALLALEAITGQQFIHTRIIPRKPKPERTPDWLRKL